MGEFHKKVALLCMYCLRFVWADSATNQYSISIQITVSTQ